MSVDALADASADASADALGERYTRGDWVEMKRTGGDWVEITPKNMASKVC